MKISDLTSIIRPSTLVIVVENGQQSLAKRTLEEIVTLKFWADKEVKFISPGGRDFLVVYC